MTILNDILTSQTDPIFSKLARSNQKFDARYPGDKPDRQPVHTVYGGAQLFKSTTIKKLGELACRSLEMYAPDAKRFASIFDLNLSHALTETLYQRIVNKLKNDAVEDFRIDFEDGFGNRPDKEEDETAVRAAHALAEGMEDKIISPFIGIRIKPFTEELKDRGMRTLDIFISSLVEKTHGIVPRNFVVTLPKVTHKEQVSTLVRLFDVIEANSPIEIGALKLEIMIETTQSIIGENGYSTLPSLLDAADGRCVAAHFGTYDYTASCNIIADHQRMDHPSCDYARHAMKVAYGSTGIWLSDGATNIMPVGPHPIDESISNAHQYENLNVVHNAWRLAFSHTRHSLTHGYYQGWDLHPAQLPVRYGAVYSFFLEGLEGSTMRLKNFLDKAAQATLLGQGSAGNVFDDAATGQGLLNYFLRAYNCGAISESDVLAAGLSMEELRSKSFARIINGRMKS